MQSDRTFRQEQCSSSSSDGTYQPPSSRGWWQRDADVPGGSKGWWQRDADMLTVVDDAHVPDESKGWWQRDADHGPAPGFDGDQPSAPEQEKVPDGSNGRWQWDADHGPAPGFDGEQPSAPEQEKKHDDANKVSDDKFMTDGAPIQPGFDGVCNTDPTDQINFPIVDDQVSDVDIDGQYDFDKFLTDHGLPYDPMASPDLPMSRQIRIDGQYGEYIDYIHIVDRFYLGEPEEANISKERIVRAWPAAPIPQQPRPSHLATPWVSGTSMQPPPLPLHAEAPALPGLSPPPTVQKKVKARSTEAFALPKKAAPAEPPPPLRACHGVPTAEASPVQSLPQIQEETGLPATKAAAPEQCATTIYIVAREWVDPKPQITVTRMRGVVDGTADGTAELHAYAVASLTN